MVAVGPLALVGFKFREDLNIRFSEALLETHFIAFKGSEIVDMGIWPPSYVADDWTHIYAPRHVMDGLYKVHKTVGELETEKFLEENPHLKPIFDSMREAIRKAI